MKQLSKTQTVIYHLYPGLCITAGFVVLSPWFNRAGYPPQFGLLLAVLLVALPVLLLHLYKVKAEENLSRITQVNQLRNKLPFWRLILYAFLLLISAFLIWGLTQPIDQLLSKHLLSWLPGWYRIQSFAGYSKEKIKVTLLLNLLLNGLAAPLVEEFYFRGYLLPRMQQAWGRWAFAVNAILFSLYHFWQPDQYVTLIIALLPLAWMAAKTRCLWLAILTHTLMNLTGALLSLGLLK